MSPPSIWCLCQWSKPPAPPALTGQARLDISNWEQLKCQDSKDQCLVCRQWTWWHHSQPHPLPHCHCHLTAGSSLSLEFQFHSVNDRYKPVSVSLLINMIYSDYPPLSHSLTHMRKFRLSLIKFSFIKAGGGREGRAVWYDFPHFM